MHKFTVSGVQKSNLKAKDINKNQPVTINFGKNEKMQGLFCLSSVFLATITLKDHTFKLFSTILKTRSLTLYFDKILMKFQDTTHPKY